MVVGYADLVPGEGRVKTLKLATDSALYQSRRFDVGVQSATAE